MYQIIILDIEFCFTCGKSDFYQNIANFRNIMTMIIDMINMKENYSGRFCHEMICLIFKFSFRQLFFQKLPKIKLCLTTWLM